MGQSKVSKAVTGYWITSPLQQTPPVTNSYKIIRLTFEMMWLAWYLETATTVQECKSRVSALRTGTIKGDFKSIFSLMPGKTSLAKG